METIKEIVERIPRAFEIVALELDITPQELQRQIEAGQIDSTKFLNVLAGWTSEDD